MLRKSLQAEIFNRLFFQYARYLKYELANSLQQNTHYAREANILIIFRDAFYFLITSHKQMNDTLKKDLLANIAENINTYIRKCPKYIDLECEKILESDFDIMSLIDENFKDILTSYFISCEEFKMKFDRIKKKYTTDNFYKHKGRSVLLQSLLEFNNALSHLAIVFYNGKDSDGNIQKAESHLYRGCLDNYKMLIRFTLPICKNLDIDTTFNKIRKQEFLLLGKKINNKNTQYIDPITKKKESITIANAYKELSTAIFQKIPKECLKGNKD